MFEGLSGGPGSLIKYNPLSNYNSEEMWNFLRVMDVPINELHNCGYDSIGCEPCTRPVLPNQQVRPRGCAGTSGTQNITVFLVSSEVESHDVDQIQGA